MATVTKPIALNESFVSTELTPRTVADILAEELPRITGRDASQVSYDNTASGLSATDVQNALDEIVGDIPTVNDGTLTIQQNGVTKASFSANTASDVIANIKTPTADEKTATDEFSTVNGGLLSECNVTLAPVQDLHGYDNPWVGGAGKNKLPLTLANLKSENTGGTWNDNVYSYQDVTFTVLTDSGDNVTGIKVNGTPNANVNFRLYGSISFTQATILNGSPSNGSGSSYFILIGGVGYDFGTGCAISANTSVSVIQITIASGYTADNLMFYPMIRLASVVDDTFAPYSNICPISGHTQVKVDVNSEEYTQSLGTTVYGGTDEVVGGSGEVTKGIVVYDGSPDETMETIFGDRLAIQAPNDTVVNSDGSKLMGCISNEFKELTNNETAGSPVYGFHLRANGTHQFVFKLGSEVMSVAQWRTWLSNNPVTVCYPKDAPTTLSTSPTQIETVVGENTISLPLDGQTLEGVKYKELFTLDDVKTLIAEKVPDAPTTDGTYTLTATVSGGVPTYSWT